MYMSASKAMVAHELHDRTSHNVSRELYHIVMVIHTKVAGDRRELVPASQQLATALEGWSFVGWSNGWSGMVQE